MAVTTRYNFSLRTTETATLGSELAGSSGQQDIIVENPLSGVLNAGTTTPATKVFSDTAQLSAGAATIDLTSYTDTRGVAAQSMSGLKVQLVKISAASANTAKITVTDGATNGYAIFGSTSSNVDVFPGGCVMYYAPEGLADVAAGAKTIDLSSSDVDATYSIEIVSG